MNGDFRATKSCCPAFDWCARVIHEPNQGFLLRGPAYAWEKALASEDAPEPVHWGTATQMSNPDPDLQQIQKDSRSSQTLQFQRKACVQTEPKPVPDV